MDTQELHEAKALRRAVNRQTNQQSCCCLVVSVILAFILLYPIFSGFLLVLV